MKITPFLSGDPILIPPHVDSLSSLWTEVGDVLPGPPGQIVLAPRVALVHALGGTGGRTTVRWARLPHGPSLHPGTRPAEIVILLTAPWSLGVVALRLAARLKACLRDAAVLEQVRLARTRESLVAALAGIEETAGEAPLAPSEVLGILGTTSGGLAAGEVARRQRECGANQLERVRQRPLILRLLEQFVSFFAVLLWVGGGFAFLAGMPPLGWAIFAVILINGLFSFLQEYRAERMVEALQSLLPRIVRVVRDGVESDQPAADLVPGDIVRVEEGDPVPADGQLLAAAGLRVDQSALTGESHPAFKLPATSDDRARVPRVERQELLFAGTAVLAGEGTLVVTATGMTTEIGDIARLTQSVTEEPSPLQREMVRVTRVVTILALSFGLVFLVLGVATGALSFAQGFLFALGVIIANVPEGLLPTLTLALALGVQRMARQRCIVKRLSAVEALGSTSVICTDKTGTLTRNRMAAHFLWISGRTITADGLGPGAPADVRELLEAACLVCQATAERGDPTEMALLVAAKQAGADPDRLRGARAILAPYPFDSFRKRMTLVRAAGMDAIAYVKGAPRETVALCREVRWYGKTRPLSRELRETILAEHDRLASLGLRILAVAVRPLPAALVGAPVGEIERDLTLLGLVALWDPPRPEVPEAIALCRRAGIRVVMVTGDYGLTARAIARQIGLPVEKVISGEELDRLPADALRGILTEPGILFARTSPAHKLAIVTALRDLGEVVAVTGDDVNDAPALKAADIGVAMGQRGSEVAREAAEMVITDDNFASIISAIREGRTIHANMGKFVTYIFASNVPELVPFLIFVFFGVPLPLTVMQILAVDLGTDMLPALALGAEPTEPGVMDRPPCPRGQRLLGGARLLRAYAFLGAAEAALSLAAFFWTYWIAGWRPGLPMAGSGDLYHRATTMTLAGIVAAQVGNVFACRTDRESIFRVGLLRNRLVLQGVAAEIGVMLLLVMVPPLARLFELAPLRFREWGILLVFPFVMIVLEEIRKWLARIGSLRSPRE